MLRLASHPLVILLFTLISAALFISLRQSARETSKSAEIVLQALEEFQELDQEVVSLRQETELANSPLRQEKIIRNELLQQVPGERTVQMPILDSTGVEKVAPTPSPTPWEEWRKLLF
jgi:hypothetical protein